VFGLLVAAVGLGASNAAVAIGIGLSGVDARTRLRVAVVFGAFEAGMPLVGLALGQRAASAVGGPAQQVGGALLVLLGLWEMLARGHDVTSTVRAPGLGRLAATGFVLSLDNLVVGFALGSLHVSFVVAAVTIGGVSIALSLLGLEIGSRVGARLERRGQLLGGAVLIALGLALAAGLA
jgi:manganese efflux pump family protein